MPTLTTLPEPEVQRRWKKWSSESNGDGGDPYTGYDRFGRWVHMRWFKEDTTPVPLVNVKWGYNRASLKTWRQDVLATSLSAAQDQYFTYDGLYQVNGRQLGVLNGTFTGITGTPVQAEDFTYDETGNWVTYEQSNVSTLDIDQSREHNTSNQITEIDELSSGAAYDANGNMLKIPTGGAALDGSPRKMIWDAWNRLRKVTDNADNVLATYEYDAKTRRTVSITATTRHTYYNDQWRSVEERLGSSTSAERQQVWHPKDRWDLLLRDRSTTNDGTFDERLYSLKDQLDPVTICDASGEIQERYAYSAFGRVTVLDKDFVERTVNESDFDWNWLFHGEFSDEVTSWYNYGYRYYVADLGRWISRDPIGERGGVNLYGMGSNNLIGSKDILGLLLPGEDYDLYPRKKGPIAPPDYDPFIDGPYEGPDYIAPDLTGDFGELPNAFTPCLALKCKETCYACCTTAGLASTALATRSLILNGTKCSQLTHPMAIATCALAAAAWHAISLYNVAKNGAQCKNHCDSLDGNVPKTVKIKVEVGGARNHRGTE